MWGLFRSGKFRNGNFAEVTEKHAGNFADHLQCNAVYGLGDPKTHGLICQLNQKRVEPAQVPLTLQGFSNQEAFHGEGAKQSVHTCQD